MAKRGPKGPSKYTKKFVERLADKLPKFIAKQRSDSLPLFIERFCTRNYISKDKVSLFCRNDSEYYNEKFHNAYKIFKDEQLCDIAEKAMIGKYDPGFAFRTLKNVAGWRDEQYIKGEGFNNVFNIITPKNYTPRNKNNRLIVQDTTQNSEC